MSQVTKLLRQRSEPRRTVPAPQLSDERESYASRSNAIARKQEFFSLVFRNCYYLWRIARSKGDAAAEKMNERTLRAYLSKVDETMPETSAFREALGATAAGAMGGEA